MRRLAAVLLGAALLAGVVPVAATSAYRGQKSTAGGALLTSISFEAGAATVNYSPQ